MTATLTGIVTAVALGLLGTAAALVLVVVLRSRSLADRAVGVDTFVAVLLNALAVVLIRTGRTEIAVLVLVITLLGFVGTATVARFIERRGR